jgi:hypothetical protein
MDTQTRPQIRPDQLRVIKDVVDAYMTHLLATRRSSRSSIRPIGKYMALRRMSATGTSLGGQRIPSALTTSSGDVGPHQGRTARISTTVRRPHSIDVMPSIARSDCFYYGEYLDTI